MKVNTTATKARDTYRALPYHASEREHGRMSAGFGMHRDSDPLEESNYFTALKLYEAEGVEVREDRFNHWAVGWVDQLTVAITPASVRVLEELRERIENYPVLDDEDFSQREWDSDHEGEHCSSEYCAQESPRPCGLKGWDEE